MRFGVTSARRCSPGFSPSKSSAASGSSSLPASSMVRVAVMPHYVIAPRSLQVSGRVRGKANRIKKADTRQRMFKINK